MFNDRGGTEKVPALPNMVTNGLHVIHDNMKTDVKPAGWNIRKILKAIWNLPDESPARHKEYESIAERNVYLLQFFSAGSARMKNAQI